MSTLKHSIRHQQAQLNGLEAIVRVGPRPYAPDTLSELNDTLTMSSSAASSTNVYLNGGGVVGSPQRTGTPQQAPSSFRDVGEGSSLSSSLSSGAAPSAAQAIKVKRRTSYDVLHGLAGPESNLPLPRRIEGTASASDAVDASVIREGVPISFGVGSASSTSSPPGQSGSYKRNSSPTRTMSRIPISAVGNARALADEGQGLVSRSPSLASRPSANDTTTSGEGVASPTAIPSPSKRLSFTPGNTTKVLADLQTGVVNARNALEHTKSQLRLSQRTVSQLTRQTEDLKESRERLRLENEGLNNVVARKERLLQEVLERARKAEAEAANLKQQLKSETSTSKKALREMESALTESTALSSKSEREYITLRDSMKGLIEAWKLDTERLRDEVNKRDARAKAEAEKTGKQYRLLVEQIKKAEAGREKVKALQKESQEKDTEVEVFWQSQIAKMREDLDESNKKSDAAVKTAKTLEEELARLRRLMRAAGRVDSADGEQAMQANTIDS